MSMVTLTNQIFMVLALCTEGTVMLQQVSSNNKKSQQGKKLQQKYKDILHNCVLPTLHQHYYRTEEYCITGCDIVVHV